MTLMMGEQREPGLQLMLAQCTNTFIGLVCVFYYCYLSHCHYCGMCWLALQIICNSFVEVKYSK